MQKNLLFAVAGGLAGLVAFFLVIAAFASVPSPIQPYFQNLWIVAIAGVVIAIFLGALIIIYLVKKHL